MVLIFRVLLGLMRGLIRGKVRGALDDSVIRLTVLPTDADLYFHLNNGRYLSLSDLGRLDLAMGSGLWRVMLRNRWFPVAASSTARFRKSIDLFRRFDLRSRLVGWDTKWIYVAHWFELDGEIAATILFRVVFLKGREAIAPSTLFEAMGIEAEAERVPEWIRHWKETEERIKPMMNRATEEPGEEIDREQVE